MTEKFNGHGIKKVDHSTFGGLIFPSDFNTNRRDNGDDGSSIASRIVSDMKFDEQCRKNAESRNINSGGNENNEWKY